jgi:hypothetical protein
METGMVARLVWVVLELSEEEPGDGADKLEVRRKRVCGCGVKQNAARFAFYWAGLRSGKVRRFGRAVRVLQRGL